MTIILIYAHEVLQNMKKRRVRSSFKVSCYKRKRHAYFRILIVIERETMNLKVANDKDGNPKALLINLF